LQRVVQTIRISVVALREVWYLHKVIGGEEAGNHRVVQSAVHVDDFQVGVMLVPGEAPGETESSRQAAGQRGGVEGEPVGIGLHVAPRVEVQVSDYLFVGVGDMGVAAKAVGMDIVHAIDTVAAHADGGEAGGIGHKSPRISRICTYNLVGVFCGLRTIWSVTVHTILGHKDTKNGVKLLSEIWGTLNNIPKIAGEAARLLGGVAYPVEARTFQGRGRKSEIHGIPPVNEHLR